MRIDWRIYASIRKAIFGLSLIETVFIEENSFEKEYKMSVILSRLSALILLALDDTTRITYHGTAKSTTFDP